MIVSKLYSGSIHAACSTNAMSNKKCKRRMFHNNVVYPYGWISIVGLILAVIISSSSASTTSSSLSYSLKQKSIDSSNLESIPFFQSGLGKRLLKRYRQAQVLAALEQKVDDRNAHWIASAPSYAISTTKRTLIAMPLDDRFDPPVGILSHGHVQTGDKMSLPKVFWQAIQLNHAEVPWLFQVSRLDKNDDNNANEQSITITTGDRVQLKSELETNEEDDDEEEDDEDEDDDEDLVTTTKKAVAGGAPPSMEPLDKVVGGPIDFRAPPNYVFLPWWMIRALGIKPRDVVEVEMITTVAPGSLAKLRPLTSDTLRDIKNPQAVLETELRQYSSLTKGSTIAFDYNKKRHWFDVVQLRSAPRGEKQPMVKTQDCDIATDFLPAKDTLNKKKKKNKNT